MKKEISYTDALPYCFTYKKEYFGYNYQSKPLADIEILDFGTGKDYGYQVYLKEKYFSLDCLSNGVWYDTQEKALKAAVAEIENVILEINLIEKFKKNPW